MYVCSYIRKLLSEVGGSERSEGSCFAKPSNTYDFRSLLQFTYILRPAVAASASAIEDFFSRREKTLSFGNRKIDEGETCKWKVKSVFSHRGKKKWPRPLY